MPPSITITSIDDDKENTSNNSSNNKKSYPFTWTPLTLEEKLRRRQIYFELGPWCVSPRAPMLDLIHSSPGNVLMPRRFAEIAEEIYNFEVRDDDVFVVTYPKCGTTWTQELVWQILHNVDLEKGQESLLTRSPFLEMPALTTDDEGCSNNNNSNSLSSINKMPSPRVIKTHLPLDMLPPDLLRGKAKVVFVARNPMDCCVSFFHHERLIKGQGFAGSFDQYAEMFRRGRNPMGDYFYHLKSGWTRRHLPNVKFLWFEDMRSDLDPIIREVSSFLNKKSLAEDKIDVLRSHLHIDNFRKNSSVNMEENFKTDKAEEDEVEKEDCGGRGEGRGSFIRSGHVGGWKEYFSQERRRDWKGWVEENTAGTGLNFSME